MGSSHKDDIVAHVIFGDALIHPVSTIERNIVWKCIFRDPRIEHDAHLHTTRRDGKRTKHVLT